MEIFICVAIVIAIAIGAKIKQDIDRKNNRIAIEKGKLIKLDESSFIRNEDTPDILYNDTWTKENMQDRYLYEGSYRIPIYKMPNNTESVASEINIVDKEFSSEEFLQIVGKTFLNIQEARTREELTKIRGLVSEFLFEQYRLEAQENKERKQNYVVNNISIKYLALNNFEIDGDKETITAWLSVAMREYMQDKASNRALTNVSIIPKLFNYKLIFIRKRGVISNKVLVNCPSCGAEVEMQKTGECEYCKSIINVAAHGWVLNNVETVKERETVDINEMHEIDPLFSESKFLEWANAVFIQLQQAYNKQNLSKAANYCTIHLLDVYNEMLAKNKIYNKREIREQIKIEHSIVKGVNISEEFETIYLKVTTYMYRYFKDIKTGITVDGVDKFDTKKEFNVSFVRKAGIGTKPEEDISTLHCPSCGAPENASNECEFCGTRYEMPKTDWLIDKAEIIEYIPK